MTQYKKPLPKSQREISESLSDPFDVTRGNPNQKVNPNESETGISFNRSEKISFRDDNTKPFSIGIKDLDEAIFYYFNNIIQPNIFQNGKRINVPLTYSNPENWKSFQKDGFYRDKTGAIMLPIIAIKRNSLTKDRSVTNKIDANSPGLYSSFQKTYNPKNAYSNFNVLNNRVPTKQFNAVVVPDFVTLEYEGVIQTYYMEQMNSIIEAIQYASDSYWGDPERFKFRAFIDSFSTNVEMSNGEDRVVKTTFTLRLRGYIVPEVLQKDLNSIKKFNSKSKIIIGVEATYGSEIFDPNATKLPDGRIRKNKSSKQTITGARDITPESQIKDINPGSELQR